MKELLTPELDSQWRQDGLVEINQQYGYAEPSRRMEPVMDFLKRPEHSASVPTDSPHGGVRFGKSLED